MLFPSPHQPAGPPRVVVTGAGIVTALGVGWAANADGFRAGRTSFAPVTLFDVSRQRAKRAAEVKLPGSLPANRLTPSRARRLDRAAQMLLLAGSEALQACGWAEGGEFPLVLGTSACGMALGEEFFRGALETPPRRHGQAVRAFYYQPHVQARAVADALGFGGPIAIVSTACASGSDAIGHAWELLRRGRAERALAGGYDALCQMVFAGFDALQALSPTTCRPFDASRDGLALGEGAALLALETLASATRRNATILGEVVGYGSAIDLHHLTQPHPEGDAAFLTMSRACQAAGLDASDIDYVNAHGTGTLLNDSSEALAIARWAAARTATLPVSSTKAAIGHLLGAAGAVEAVVCLMALQGQWLPPEIVLETVDPVCRFPVVREPRDAKLRTALSSSFGFGGANATLIFRKWV